MITFFKQKHKTLIDWPEGTVNLIRENLIVSRHDVVGNIEIRGKQNLLFPRDQALSDFFQNKWVTRAEIPATTIDHLQLHAVVTCNSGQHFEGNAGLFPV